MVESTVPILPCQTLPPVLDFYTALGFEVTVHQRNPEPYAVVQRGGIQLHFLGMQKYDPGAGYSTCLVRTDDVDALHAAFQEGLRSAYGQVPTQGLPRLGAVGDTPHGVREFLLTDPGGNCLRIGQSVRADRHHRPSSEEPFAKALHHAALFADSQEDPAAAARVLDRALESPDGPPAPLLLFRILALRADLAHRLADGGSAEALTRRAESIAEGLTAEERESVRDELGRLAGLLVRG
ncbi:VOC family protein [Kitasatospora purpeofusca]|uniref:bleomycin resistance protein n=1 Tax=Kitasatospora purpeofusca TaxID=67352 RepID=UPI00224E8A57|nr:VOC family protein [Kitasatospora purpeofusca]MCX4756784.1 VOC family protein [Kitasatospora purpeofusca]WSR35432.1 VOC family protein [Kitasatospora purpeofusca]WSR43751.1 VOC family protein [Kitasatospora purpeofusca]